MPIGMDLAVSIARRRSAAGTAPPPPPIPASIFFGTGNLAGTGGISVAGLIANGTYTGWQVVGGILTPTVNNPTAGIYTVGGASVEVLANTIAVRNQTEWNALTSASFGRTVLVRQGALILWDQSVSGTFGRGADMLNTIVRGDGSDPRADYYANPADATKDGLAHFSQIVLQDTQNLRIDLCRIVSTTAGQRGIWVPGDSTCTRIRISRNLLVMSRPKVTDGNYDANQIINGATVLVPGVDGQYPGGAGIQISGRINGMATIDNVIYGASQGIETNSRWYNIIQGNRIDVARNDFIQVKSAGDAPQQIGGNYTSRPMYEGSDGHRDSLQILGGTNSSVVEAHCHFDGASIGKAQVLYFNNSPANSGFRTLVRHSMSCSSSQFVIQFFSGWGSQVQRFSWVPPASVALPTGRGQRRWNNRTTSDPNSNRLEDSILALSGEQNGAALVEVGNIETRNRDAASINSLFVDRTFGGAALPTMRQLLLGAVGAGEASGKGCAATLAANAEQSAYVIPGISAPILSSAAVSGISSTTATYTIRSNVAMNAIFYVLLSGGSPTPTADQIRERTATGGLVYGFLNMPYGSENTDIVLPLSALVASTSYRVAAVQWNGLNVVSAVSTVNFTTTSGVVVQAPQNTQLPVILGEQRVGRVLTVQPGVWTNVPTAILYQWRRNNVDIAGAIGTSYTPVDADADTELTVRETASNAGGSNSVTSLPTELILFAFELRDQLGSATIASIINLRLSVGPSGPWRTVAAHNAATGDNVVVSRHPDGDKITLSGFASQSSRDAVFIHYEKNTGAEINSPQFQLDALFVRSLNDATPVNTAMPGGLQLAATVQGQPLGVTP